MRRRIPLALAAGLALAAAALVGGCRVDVNGALCGAKAGRTDECPGGQACGNDGRCSERALACSQSRSRCVPGQSHCDDTAAAVVCTNADPVCGRWVIDDCEARQMICGTRSGVGACECPPSGPGPTIFAAPSGGSSRDAFPFPNGQRSPPECRFGRLSDALAAASALAPASATVQIDAEGASTVTFEEATAAAWPLFVASNVTLLAAEAPAVATVIQGRPEAAAVLAVEGGVEGVHVDAEGATTGVRVTAPGARLVRVSVAGASGAALEVMAGADPTAAATVEVIGGSYGASRFGMWIRGGKVRVSPDPARDSSAVASENPGSTVVEGNQKDGIVVGGDSGRGLPLTDATVDVVLNRMSVHTNGGTGILLAGLPSSAHVRITGSDIWSNGSIDPFGYEMSGRKAGGVLAYLLSNTEVAFTGNRFWSNARDQLLFALSGTWRVGPPNPSTCGPESNVFACVPPSTSNSCNGDLQCAVALTATGSVDASGNVWPGDPVYPYVTLNNVSYAPYCNGRAGVPPTPTCP